MSTENKPVEKEEIINEDENLQNKPEVEGDSAGNEEQPEESANVVDPAGDEDTGGSTPGNKPRG